MHKSLKAISPLLAATGILLIFSGSALALCFGYVAWQVLFHPEQVAIVTYILQNIATTVDAPAITANVDGRVAVYHLSTSVKAYGLCYLFITGLSLLISTARCMSDAGVHIMKLLWPQPAAALPQRKVAPAAPQSPKTTI